MMASLRHPSIVMYLGVCLDPPAVVTEYCAKGSLLDVLRAAHASGQAATTLPWVRRLSMVSVMQRSAATQQCSAVHGGPRGEPQRGAVGAASRPPSPLPVGACGVF